MRTEAVEADNTYITEGNACASYWSFIEAVLGSPLIGSPAHRLALTSIDPRKIAQSICWQLEVELKLLKGEFT